MKLQLDITEAFEDYQSSSLCYKYSWIPDQGESSVNVRLVHAPPSTPFELVYVRSNLVGILSDGRLWKYESENIDYSKIFIEGSMDVDNPAVTAYVEIQYKLPNRCLSKSSSKSTISIFTIATEATKVRADIRWTIQWVPSTLWKRLIKTTSADSLRGSSSFRKIESRKWEIRHSLGAGSKLGPFPVIIEENVRFGVIIAYLAGIGTGISVDVLKLYLLKVLDFALKVVREIIK